MQRHRAGGAPARAERLAGAAPCWAAPGLTPRQQTSARGARSARGTRASCPCKKAAAVGRAGLGLSRVREQQDRSGAGAAVRITGGRPQRPGSRNPGTVLCYGRSAQERARRSGQRQRAGEQRPRKRATGGRGGGGGEGRSGRASRQQVAAAEGSGAAVAQAGYRWQRQRAAAQRQRKRATGGRG
jgi:hypothetical protein